MAPLPVIADIARVELEWSNGAGATAVNVFHVEAPGLTEAEIGAVLEAHWDDTMQSEVSGAFEFHEWKITLLDGASPQVAVPNGGHSGGAGGDAIPEQAQVVSLRTGTRGPRGRGRLYLGPVTESSTSFGSLSSSVVATIIAAWITFANAIEADANPVRLVVASYKYATAAPVTNITGGTGAGTQVRRLRRVR